MLLLRETARDDRFGSFMQVRMRRMGFYFVRVYLKRDVRYMKWVTLLWATKY